MFLNSIQPTKGATHARRHVGRGISSSSGKAGGHGCKGQRSRSSGFHKVGSEGDQMPLQRCPSKRDFKSLAAAANAGTRLSGSNLLAVSEIDILVLKQAGLVPAIASSVKIIASGELPKAIALKGIKATRGVKVAIETASGKVEE